MINKASGPGRKSNTESSVHRRDRFIRVGGFISAAILSSALLVLNKNTPDTPPTINAPVATSIADTSKQVNEILNDSTTLILDKEDITGQTSP